MWNRVRTIPRQHLVRKINVFAKALICAAFLLLSTSSMAAENATMPTKTATPIKDIRILIDISGSMKKTDPNNLRQPAVKLFANLLPENILSGVWTFGKWVNMLVPHGMADSAWKANVHTQAQNINSTGLFTNIEEALRRATWDWKEYDPAYERSMIILSDGVVDISKNPEENRNSRSRILKDILPSLTNAKVTIHTIALSSLSDKDLLQQLSFATGGIHETIETTTELDKTFMRIFDVATPRDEIPLIDNQVKIDESIKEITFLIFRKEKSPKTVIITPSGGKYTKNSEDVTWHSEKRYDLVTIKNPETGTWGINADTDPDNRVMVVTDLRLITNRLPDNILSGDRIPFYAHLESEQKIIKRRDFLHFVRMSIRHFNETKKKKRSVKLKDDGIGIDEDKRDGIYSAEIKKTKTLGKHTFELLVNGTTFKRKNTKIINIVKYPAIININNTPDGDIAIKIVPYQDLVDTESLQITAIHHPPVNNSEEYRINKTNLSAWKATIPTNNISGNHTVTIEIIGKNKSGKTINFVTEPESIFIGEKNQEYENNNRHSEKNPEESNHEESDNKENKSTTWFDVILSIVVFNLVLLFFIFSLYKLWGKYKHKLLPPPCEEMINA